MDKVYHLDGGGTVDFVPGVARLVIVAVKSGEEEQNRNGLGGKRSVIARAKAALRKVDFEVGRLV
jgi:hypothetical protein